MDASLFTSAVNEVEAMGARRAQGLDEAKRLLEYFEGRPIHTYVEIGARHGWTFYLVGKLLKPRHMLAVDLPGVKPWGDDGSEVCLQAVVDSLKSYDCYPSIMWGDSHHYLTVAEVANYMSGELSDFTFVDGDHTYDGVTADYVNYWPMSNAMAFHDTHTLKGGVMVKPAWEKIKLDHPHTEIFSDYSGIGIIERGVPVNERSR